MKQSKIFSGKYLKVFLEIDKYEKTREKAYLRDSINLLVTDEKGNFFLLTERRWEKGGKKMTKLISGLIEEGESPIQAMRRELAEETNLDIKRLKKVATIFEKGTINQKRHYYLGILGTNQDSYSLRKYSRSGLREAILKGEFGFQTTGALVMFLNAVPTRH